MRARRTLRFGLTVCLLAVIAAFAGLILVAALGGIDWSRGFQPSMLATGLLIVLGIGAIWIAGTLLEGHFEDLERLRADIVGVNPANPSLPRRWAEERPAIDESGRLAMSMAELVGRFGDLAAQPDRRLAAVLGAIEEGLLVITASGLVSVANGAARAVLGAEQAAPGTSVFAALEREPLVAALDRARDANRPIAAGLRLVDGSEIEARICSLGPLGGAVLSFSASAIEHHAAVEMNLALHDEPPPAGRIDDDTPLQALPIVVLDTETTGLDVASDRVVSIGAVRMHGQAIFPHVAIDRLVNPGRPIPARSTAVHGITDAMVADAPDFAGLHGRLTAFLDGCVLVGHNINFDRTLLRAEAARIQLPWTDPPTLDTGHLMAALYPEMNDIDLDSIAGRLGVEGRGRHTALGDSLVAAEVFAKLISLLADRGIRTFGEARHLAAQPKRLIGSQKAAGW